ncbi:hypothetical protein WJX72_010261 [[Myrmecia] bisecta]|uniref:Uncharacterized protein n=1 Tax=[Myrmecia] bisecta TaxID=41462 RepID=A0AAW1PY26_9CHLO
MCLLPCVGLAAAAPAAYVVKSEISSALGPKESWDPKLDGEDEKIERNKQKVEKVQSKYKSKAGAVSSKYASKQS